MSTLACDFCMCGVLFNSIDQQHFLTDLVNVFNLIVILKNNLFGMIPLVDTLPGFVPRFLSMLEEEVYSQNSPIWDQDFMVSSSRTGQLGIQTGTLHLVMGNTNENCMI